MHSPPQPLAASATPPPRSPPPHSPPAHAPPLSLPQKHASLDQLLRERAAIHPIRVAVPHLWALLDAEIARRIDSAAAATAAATATANNTNIRPSAAGSPTDAPNSTSTSPTSSASSSASASAPAPPPASPPPPPPPQSSAAQPQHQQGLPRSNTAPLPALKRPSVAPRKRIKIPVPADKFPEYNFVGRLLGPRGTTLKTLERDTRCKIMIRGKGSIRKDKEPEVRGKPGWEHVFNEPLHVVIELADHMDEPAATAALNRAKDDVEFLLVPVPEERDALKRQQLRALAIMNGTYRGAPARSMDHLPLPSYNTSSSAHHQHHHAHHHHSASHHLQSAVSAAAPPSHSPSHSLSSFADQLHSPAFLHDPSLSAHVLSSPFDALSPPDDHGLSRPARTAPAPGPHASHPNLAFGADFSFDRLRQQQQPMRSSNMPPLQHQQPGRRSPLSGATSPSRGGGLPSHGSMPVAHDLASLTASLTRCGVDDFTSSSVEDTPESSRSSEDGAYPPVPQAGRTATDGSMTTNFSAPPSTHVKVSSISPPTRPDTSLGVGGFIGREFYNGAFSNQSLSQSPWDQAPSSSSAALSNSNLYRLNSPVPSPEVLTSFMSTVTPIERHYDGY